MGSIHQRIRKRKHSHHSESYPSGPDIDPHQLEMAVRRAIENTMGPGYRLLRQKIDDLQQDIKQIKQSALEGRLQEGHQHTRTHAPPQPVRSKGYEEKKEPYSGEQSTTEPEPGEELVDKVEGEPKPMTKADFFKKLKESQPKKEEIEDYAQQAQEQGAMTSMPSTGFGGLADQIKSFQTKGGDPTRLIYGMLQQLAKDVKQIQNDMRYIKNKYIKNKK